MTKPRILKNPRVHDLHEIYTREGSVACPECGEELHVMTIPNFSSYGRASHATFCVACRSCGVSGAVERREMAAV